MRPVRTQGAAAPVATTADDEKAFETWLIGTLVEPELADLRQGARLFAAASRESTYRQAKVALAQVLAHCDKHAPTLTVSMFRTLQLVLEVKAAELPQAEAARERLALREGRLEVPVELPQAVLGAVSDAANAMVDRYAKELGVAVAPSAQDRTASVRSQATARTAALDARICAGLNERQWGAFLGRTISDVFDADESRALDDLAARGRMDRALVFALEQSGASADRGDDGAWARRVGAAIDLARRAQYASLDDHDRRALTSIAASNTTPTMSYEPIRSLKDGDIEGMLHRFMKVTVPRFASAAIAYHPHIVEPEALPALSEQMDGIAREDGAFLSEFNVLTIMHQTAGCVPWLRLLEEKLGMRREDYLGISVPYSGSPIAIARLNQEGFETRADHDPRDPLLAAMQDTLGAGNPQAFDELKEQNLRRGIAALVERAEKNGKKMMIIDDGGYAGHVIRKYFAEHEHRFVIVEWTTRGVRKFEQLQAPKFPLLSAAESAPKTAIEPAFVADALRDACVVSMQNRLGTLKDKSLLLVGFGHIGRAVALVMQAKGMRVTVSDVRKEALEAARRDGFLVEPDMKKAVANKHAILAATGANSMPPEIFSQISHGTVIASASSVDIETRSPVAAHNGTWGRSLIRRELYVEDGEQRAIDRELLGGGYVLNMTRRTRLMAPEREEVIFMNVTEAIAQIADETRPGKHLMTTDREARIDRLYAKHRPAAYAHAKRFAATSG